MMYVRVDGILFTQNTKRKTAMRILKRVIDI